MEISVSEALLIIMYYISHEYTNFNDLSKRLLFYQSSKEYAHLSLTRFEHETHKLNPRQPCRKTSIKMPSSCCHHVLPIVLLELQLVGYFEEPLRSVYLFDDRLESKKTDKHSKHNLGNNRYLLLSSRLPNKSFLSYLQVHW